MHIVSLHIVSLKDLNLLNVLKLLITMKNIFLNIQDHLQQTIPTLKYIDKNWGQLTFPQPPVKYPCALIDLDNIDYTQAARQDRLATATIAITIAGQRLRRSSALAPAHNDAYNIFDLLEQVMAALDGHTIPGTCQQLIRTNLRKDLGDDSHDIYTITFTTAWLDKYENGATIQATPSIHVRLESPTIQTE